MFGKIIFFNLQKKLGIFFKKFISQENLGKKLGRLHPKPLFPFEKPRMTIQKTKQRENVQTWKKFH